MPKMSTFRESSSCSTQDDENLAPTQTDLEYFGIEELEEIENTLPETSDDETGSDDDFGMPKTIRPATISPPGLGLGITISSREIIPGDLISREAQPSNKSEQPRSATGLLLPFPIPAGPSKVSENAARIQEIRDFFYISPSIPTRAIPSFFKNHSRIAESLGNASYLTRAGISARHQNAALFSSNPARMDEIYDMLMFIDWEQEEESRFSEDNSDTSESTSSSEEAISPEAQEAEWEAVAASKRNIIQLDDGDEAIFQQVVEQSLEESFTLVEQTQQPRLQADPNSPHRVSAPSGLKVELAVRVAGAEDDDSETWWYIPYMQA
ncbi:hypothetical protein VTL71DRAFT_2178 [Oculimacula yallundae]|uniref:Uncharacterized protein n=1 Tax=Oculimacula yallundae TaxID=86028 RepID=A0ABR4C9A6_9HELO